MYQFGGCLFLDYKFRSIFCYQILKIIRDFIENYKHVTCFTVKYLNITKKNFGNAVPLLTVSVEIQGNHYLSHHNCGSFPTNILNVRVPGWPAVSNGITQQIEPLPPFIVLSLIIPRVVVSNMWEALCYMVVQHQPQLINYSLFFLSSVVNWKVKKI